MPHNQSGRVLAYVTPEGGCFLEALPGLTWGTPLGADMRQLGDGQRRHPHTHTTIHVRRHPERIARHVITIQESLDQLDFHILKS